MISVSDPPRIAAKIRQFPLWIWDNPFFLVRQVHTGFFAETEHPRILFNIGDTKTFLVFKSPAYFIKIYVGRNSDSFRHIGPSVGAPVFKNRFLVREIRVWD